MPKPTVLATDEVDWRKIEIEPLDAFHRWPTHPYVHAVVFLTGVNGAASISDAVYISGSYQEDFESMTLLIPDRDRDNQEDFIWCLPVEREKWQKWYGLAEKFKGITPEIHGGVRYANRMDGKDVRTVIMLPTEDQSDDTVMHACAFLRMTKKIDCRIYVLRCSDHKLSAAQVMHKIIGTDPKMVEDIELDEPKEDS